MAIPYRPETTPMRGEEQETLTAIFDDQHWYTPQMRLRMANAILDAGFARRIPRKLTFLQMWTYFWETALLVLCACIVREVPGLGFVYGVLVALAIGGGLTWIGGLIINASIDKGVLK